MAHWPETQAGMPWLLEQAAPHALQCEALFSRLVSHPSAGSLLQSPQPGLQAMLQLPLTHDGVPLLLLQTLPQTLQFAASVLRLASQPFPTLLSQLP
jgi:hypothetical protein